MQKRPVIQVRDLVARYGEDTILERISFEVYEGEIFVILGGSGCGKTTLLKHLIGLIAPAAGQVIIDGDDITHCDEDRFQKILRKIGILYRSSALLGSMTLAENVALPIREYTDLPATSVATLVKMKLRQVHLNGYENYLPSEISGGMRKRAGLARAMALDPEILFVDEPSAGLDPISSRLLDDLILELRESLGTTFVVVTHELASIFTIATKSIFLDTHTRMATAIGPPAELRDHSQDPAVRAFLRRGEEEHE